MGWDGLSSRRSEPGQLARVVADVIVEEAANEEIKEKPVNNKVVGKILNQARVNGVPNNCIPCVFVIPDNKYAIRNLKLCGFEEHLIISHTSWFKKYTYTRLNLFQDNYLNEIIIKGFNTL